MPEGTYPAENARPHLDTLRLAFLSQHVKQLCRLQTGRWSVTLPDLSLPILGGTVEEALDGAMEFHGWILERPASAPA